MSMLNGLLINFTLMTDKITENYGFNAFFCYASSGMDITQLFWRFALKNEKCDWNSGFH